MNHAASDIEDQRYMRRALALAAAAPAAVSPNPGVGALVVAGGRVIGEGATQIDGGPHAEVLALRSVAPADRALLPEATVYVTLEPCSIYGRTPPCSTLLAESRVARVVVGCLDFTAGVCGRGLEELRLAGVTVRVGVEQDRAFFTHRHRHVYVRERRPYVILKQAVTADGVVGLEGERLRITGPAANRESHAWRADVDAILVGVGTVNADDPSLTVRHAEGASPLRVILDPDGRAAPASNVFTDGHPTLHVTCTPAKRTQTRDGVHTLHVHRATLLPALMRHLHEARIGRLLVEGGPTTLRRFVDAGYYDEWREWRSPGLAAGGPRRSFAAATSPVPLSRAGAYGPDVLMRGYATDRIWSLKSP